MFCAKVKSDLGFAQNAACGGRTGGAEKRETRRQDDGRRGGGGRTRTGCPRSGRGTKKIEGGRERFPGNGASMGVKAAWTRCPAASGKDAVAVDGRGESISGKRGGRTAVFAWRSRRNGVSNGRPLDSDAPFRGPVAKTTVFRNREDVATGNLRNFTVGRRFGFACTPVRASRFFRLPTRQFSGPPERRRQRACAFCFPVRCGKAFAAIRWKTGWKAKGKRGRGRRREGCPP